MKDKFSDWFGYRKLSKLEGLFGVVPLRSPTTYVGVEIELENAHIKERIYNLPSSFTHEADGSLKINGTEFITRPIRFCFLEKELERLFGVLKKPLLSSRCSLHVHMNARDMNLYELRVLLYIYMLYEKALFNLSGDRYDNIFCIPLYENTDDVTKALLCKVPADLSWHKYHALNLCPIFGGESGTALGTIEFRHHEITLNIPDIINWINLIVSLKLSAKKFKEEEFLSLLTKGEMTNEEIVALTKRVFKDWAQPILEQAKFYSEFRECFSNLKRVAFMTKKISTKTSRITV